MYFPAFHSCQVAVNFQFSALEVIFNEMRYIYLRFTYLLTYLLTYFPGVRYTIELSRNTSAAVGLGHIIVGTLVKCRKFKRSNV